MDLTPRHLISRVADAIKGRKWNVEKPVIPDDAAQSDPNALNRKGRRLAAMEVGRIIRKATRRAIRQMYRMQGVRPRHHDIEFRKGAL